MEQKGLAGLFLAIILLQGTMAQKDEEKTRKIEVVEQEDGSVQLTCDLQGDIIWTKDGQEISQEIMKENVWNIGSSGKDPRGIYKCQKSVDTSKDSRSVQLYYRMCQNCIELNAATITGFILAEIISISLLAAGVYLIAGQDGTRQSRASDKQILLSNDQLYQPLKERENDQYSQLQGHPPRKK